MALDRTPALVVYVSSTWLDLQPERQAVLDLTQRMAGLRFVGMEFFGSRSQTTAEVSVAAVDGADIYVGIVGERYGSGITELEYDRACECEKPRFIYIQRGVDPDGAQAGGSLAADPLRAFVARLQRAHTCTRYDSPQDLALRLSADLHNWLFERHLTRGLARLSTDYLSRVQSFVAEYTGTAGRPVPFGGRATELAELDAWLADPGAPPYLLVAASAGRGKSALLVRWTQLLLAGDAVVPLFFPISIRFRTNLASVIFASLTAYLASLHGEKSALSPDAPAEELRGRLTDLLLRPLPGGRPLVVVLDGLDEAADWDVGPDLFPPQIGRHVRVVVSARLLADDADAGGWMRRLGWDRMKLGRSMALPGLSEAGVASVLTGVGSGLLARGGRDALVGELHRLSDGDPLLIRLYTDRLRERAEQGDPLHVEELKTTEAGLQGYFDSWWDDQRRLWGARQPLRERNVQLLMDLLASALGPLTRDDLLTLGPASAEWDSWALANMLEPLRRFIVGDGAASGYVFSHPRLAIHLRDRLPRSEQQRLDERYLAWCEERIALAERDDGAGAALPGYVVQYFGAHLDRSKADLRRYEALLRESWRQGWYALEGTHSGYRGDLQRVAQALQRARWPSAAGADGAFVDLVLRLASRCALCLASVDEVARSTPFELIAQLVAKRLWGRNGALRYARSIDSPALRAQALVHLAHGENPSDQTQILLEAIETIAAWPGEAIAAWHGEEGDWAAGATVKVTLLALLAGVAETLPAEVQAAALDLALSLATPAARAQALRTLLPRLGPLALRRALERARSLTGGQDLLGLLAAAAPDEWARVVDAPGIDAWSCYWVAIGAADASAAAVRGPMLERARDALESALAAAGRPGAAERRALLELASRIDGSLRGELVERARRACESEPASAAKAAHLLWAAALDNAAMPAAHWSAALAALAACPGAGGSRAVLAAAPVLGVQAAAAVLQALPAGAADDPDQAAAVAALLPRLAAAERTLAAGALLDIADPQSRVEATAPLAALLLPAQVDALARAASRDCDAGADWQFEQLRLLAPWITPPAVAALLQDFGPGDGDERVLARAAALAPHLPAGLQVVSAQAVARSLRALDREAERHVPLLAAWVAHVGSAAATHVADELILRLQSAADTQPGRHACRSYLTAVAARLDRDALDRAARTLQHIGDDVGTSQVLETCFGAMPPEVVLGPYGQAFDKLAPDARGRLAAGFPLRDKDRDKVLSLIFAMPSDGAFLEAVGAFAQREGRAAEDLVRRVIATATVRAQRALALLVEGMAPALLADVFTPVLGALLRLEDARTAEIVGRVPVERFVAAFGQLCDAARHAALGDGAAAAQWRDMSALIHLAWRVDGGRRAAVAGPQWSAIDHAPERARAALAIELCRGAPLQAHALADLRRLLAGLEATPYRLRADIAFLPHAAAPDDPAFAPWLLHLHARVKAEPDPAATLAALPDGLTRDAAHAGAWMAALVLHAQSLQAQVTTAGFESEILAEVRSLAADRQVYVALSVMLRLLPTLDPRGLRDACAQTLRLARRWRYRDVLATPGVRALVAQWVALLMRRLLGQAACRRISDGFGAGFHVSDAKVLRLFLRAVPPRTLPSAVLSLLVAALRCGDLDPTLRNGSLLEEVLLGRLQRRDDDAIPAEPAPAAGGDRPGHLRIWHRLHHARIDRRHGDAVAGTWYLLLTATCGLDWDDIRTICDRQDEDSDAGESRGTPRTQLDEDAMREFVDAWLTAARASRVAVYEAMAATVLWQPQWRERHAATIAASIVDVRQRWP